MDLSLSQNTYRTLHTLPKGTVGHRIARRDSTNYYVLTSAAITQDRSAQALPRTDDKTGYAYDSRAEGSNVRIHHYNATTNVLTEFVPEDDDRPPQLGVHYWVGFENKFNIDEYEGVVPSPYSTFKVYNNNLYYRYATEGEFGVARVNTSGTTSEVVGEPIGDYWNHVNFAFDITSGGVIYFVYASGDAVESTLTIKRRTSGGAESTVLTDTQNLADLTDLDENGGAYLGALECLFHNNQLYILAPIQRVDYDEDDNEYSRSREKNSRIDFI